MKVSVGLVEGRGVGERRVGYYGAEFTRPGIEIEVRVGGVKVDC